MSDMLVHWAIFEDARRLAQQDPRIEPLFARLLQEQREIARLGALSRGGLRFVPHIFDAARAEWANAAGSSVDGLSERMGQKLAYALGGITHYAADHTLKPIMSRLAKTEWNATHNAMQAGDQSAEALQNAAAIREISVYYDVYVFRQVYLAGQEEPFSRFLLAGNASQPGQALEEFVRALFQRALLSSHTLSPDKEHFDAWLDALLDQVQPLYLDIALYTRVFTAPDPAKMAAYSVTGEFYQAADPLVLAARAAQRGETVTLETLDRALAPEANAGGYGRALALALNRLREASQYWKGERSEFIDLKQSSRYL